MEPEINPEIRMRILDAADHLYAQAGESKIPNVDAVRRTAKANMNDVSVVMKQWRRALLSKAAPVPLVIPAAVQQASQEALEQLWRTAQECANQHLRTAQAGWEQERSESDTVCQQLSKAFDDQAGICAEDQRQLQMLRDELQAMAGVLEAMELARVASETHLAAAVGRAEHAEALVSAQEQHAADMREQLASVTAALTVAQENVEGFQQRCESIAGTIRGELAQVQQQLGVAEQRVATSQALEAEMQRQVVALTNELNQVRREMEEHRQAAREAQSVAATSQGERDAMATNFAQVLAAFKSGESEAKKLSPKRMEPRQISESNSNAGQKDLSFPHD